LCTKRCFPHGATSRTRADPRLRAGRLCKVVRRIAINRRRWRGGRGEALTDHVPGATVEDMAHQTADRQLVQAALQTLPIEQREALFKTYFRRTSVDQAADVLGVPTATVMALTHDALHALRQAIDEQGRRP
jgi:RNA polymerase sigma factor (sigma-70 family)